MINLNDWKCLCKECRCEFIVYGEHPLTYVNVENIENIIKKEENKGFVAEYENIKNIYYSFLNKYSLCDKCKNKLLPKLQEPEYVEMMIYPKLYEHSIIEEFVKKEYEKEKKTFYKEIVGLYKENELKLKKYKFTNNDVFVRFDSDLSKDIKRKKSTKKLTDFMEGEMDKCERLHKILEKGKSFGFDYNKNELPDFGVYIFYEKGEFAFGGNRIVRIGITIGYYDVTGKVVGKTLHDRIKNHYKGSKRKSVFRRKIGETFLSNDLDAVKKWNNKESKNLEIEEEVSNYMVRNMTFKVIEIYDVKKREELEKRLIGTVSNCKNCCPSENWFGKNSPKEKIRKSGLWQEDHLYKEELTDEDLKEIEKNIIVHGC